MKLIIDRFEGDIAVCETDDLKHTEIQRNLLPEGVREGDAVEERNGEYIFLRDETESRRKRLKNLFDSLTEE